MRAYDRHRRVTTVPFQQPGCPARNGLTVGQCETSAWAVTPDGATYGAAAGMALLVAVILGSPLPLWLYAAPGFRRLAECGYAWVAANRSRFAGDHPYCEQFPAECGRAGR